MCTFPWLSRLTFELILLLQWLHGNGFYWLCTLLCIIRLDLSEKTFVTMISGKWPFHSMYFLVSYKFRYFGKTFVILITEIWLLPNMYFLVIYKIRSFQKTLVIMITGKWILPIMYFLVSYRSRSFGETFVTMITGQGAQNGFGDVFEKEEIHDFEKVNNCLGF